MPPPTREDVDEALRALTRPGALQHIQTIRFYLVEVDRPSRRQDVTGTMLTDEDLRVLLDPLKEKATARVIAHIDALKTDNAALHERLGEISTRLEAKELRHYALDDTNLAAKQRRVMDGAWTVARDAYASEHPGAALLERVKRLEDALREYMEHGSSDMADALAREALK